MPTATIPQIPNTWVPETMPADCYVEMGSASQPYGLGSSKMLGRSVVAPGVNMKVYGLIGDDATDNSVAFQTAFDDGGDLFLPPGIYQAQGIKIKENTRLYGVPGQSIVKGVDGTNWVVAINPSTEGTTDPADNTKNIVLSGITIQGRNDLVGQTNGIHNLIVSAATRVAIEKCQFLSFSGDGIYIGCYIAATQRHNEQITISGCLFDGVTKENRNGLTITDCTQLLVENNTFTRCTAPGEPGAIDIEPDPAAYIRLRNITIRNNQILDVGTSGGGQVAINFALTTDSQVDLTIPVSGITIEDNRISTTDKGITFSQKWDASAKAMGLAIRGNRISVNVDVGTIAMSFGGIRGITITENATTYTPNPITFYDRCDDVIICHNPFSQTELAFEYLTNAIIKDNVFDGASNNTWAIYASPGTGAATSDNLNISGNIIKGAGWTRLVKKGAGHVFGSNNRCVSNIYALSTVSNDLENYAGGSIQAKSATWNPGSLAADAVGSTVVSGFVNLDPNKFVAVAHFPMAYDAWFLTAQILNGTDVLVCILNKTGGTVDLGSATVNVTILDH